MKKLLLFLFSSLISFSVCFGQDLKLIEIDLAKIDEDIYNDLKLEVKDEAKFEIKLINTLPSMKYSVRIGDDVERTMPADLKVNTESYGCGELYEAEKFNLFYEIDEKIIRLIKQKYKENIKEYCDDETQSQLYVDSLYYLTERYYFIQGITLKKGDVIDLRIVRESSSQDEKEHIWNVTLLADEECEETIKEVVIEKPVMVSNGTNGGQATYKIDSWTLSYGFSFPIMFSNEELYHMIVSDSIADMFEIKKRKDNQYIRFIPSIFLHWNPDVSGSMEWTYSITGGIGFDSENPIIFSGGSLIYHHKLIFNFGLVVHKVFRLNGKYSSGDLLNDLLDSDQLHEEYYRMNPFIGVSFNF